jgi:hypothetical protein
LTYIFICSREDVINNAIAHTKDWLRLTYIFICSREDVINNAIAHTKDWLRLTYIFICSREDVINNAIAHTKDWLRLTYIFMFSRKDVINPTDHDAGGAAGAVRGRRSGDGVADLGGAGGVDLGGAGRYLRDDGAGAAEVPQRGQAQSPAGSPEALRR